MNTLKAEGIILHTLPFKDYDLLVTVFTHEHGLMKFIYKGGQSRRRNKGGVASPLTRAEFIFKKTTHELIPLYELSILESNFSLRSSFKILETSCLWLKLIKQTQLPGKPSEALYRFLLAFLKRLPKTEQINSLIASFYLKLLHHEGLIKITSDCSKCNALIQKTHHQEDESFCHRHSTPKSISFPQLEAQTLALLTYGKNFKKIESLEITETFKGKVEQLYRHIISLA